MQLLLARDAHFRKTYPKLQKMNEHNLVSPIEFVRRMESHWRNSLQLIPNSKLKANWYSMANCFNASISNESIAWRILSPPTGAGKTEGLILYAAMMSKINAVRPTTRTGILIVSRTKAQCDEIAQRINSLVGRTVAISRHSENPVSAQECVGKDMLVVTHEAYRLALEADYRGKPERLSRMLAHHGDLTVIDEAPANLVCSYKVTSNDLRQILALVDSPTAIKYQPQVKAIRDLLQRFEEKELLTNPKRCLLWSSGDKQSAEWTCEVSFNHLALEIMHTPPEFLEYWTDHHGHLEKFQNHVRSVFIAIKKLFNSWAFYCKSGLSHELHTAEFPVPKSLKGPVVLDATANQNILWDLMDSRAVRIERAESSRAYANATIHVARTRGTGKASLIAKANTRLPMFFKELEKRQKGSTVLLCLPMDLEEKAASLIPEELNCSLAHWGALDGKNEWQNHDTLVLASLPYRSRIDLLVTFMALQGPQSPHWLDRPTWKHFPDVIQAMEVQWVSVLVIQAINRIRCRRSTNINGDCLSSDIFIVLPKGNRGKTVLSNIETEMPGIKVEPWIFSFDDSTSRLTKRKGFEEFITFVEQLPLGKISTKQISSKLCWSLSKLKELNRALRNEAHWLPLYLCQYGVTFCHNGKGGRGSELLLTKT